MSHEPCLKSGLSSSFLADSHLDMLLKRPELHFKHFKRHFHRSPLVAVGNRSVSKPSLTARSAKSEEQRHHGAPNSDRRRCCSINERCAICLVSLIRSISSISVSSISSIGIAGIAIATRLRPTRGSSHGCRTGHEATRIRKGECRLVQRAMNFQHIICSVVATSSSTMDPEVSHGPCVVALVDLDA